jgi:hypothetical protein
MNGVGKGGAIRAEIHNRENQIDQKDCAINRPTVREFLDVSSPQMELPVVARGSSLEEVVRAGINILRNITKGGARPDSLWRYWLYVTFCECHS